MYKIKLFCKSVSHLWLYNEKSFIPNNNLDLLDLINMLEMASLYLEHIPNILLKYTFLDNCCLETKKTKIFTEKCLCF